MSPTAIVDMDDFVHVMKYKDNSKAEGAKATLLTRRQAAERFVVSTKTIQRWAKQGKLKPVNLSSHSVRYKEEEVEALIEQGVAA
jgi:excisionase family DNA binding protein